MRNLNNFIAGCVPRTARDTSNYVTVTYSQFLNRLNESVMNIDFSSLNELFEHLFKDVPEEGMNFALSLLSLFYRLYRLENLPDLFFASLDFLKSVFGVSYIIESAKFSFLFLKNNLNNLYNKILIASPKTESAPINVLKDLKSKMNMILNSEIVSAIRDFVLTLVTFRVFDKSTATRITRTLGPAKPASAMDLAEVCLSSAISILSFSDQLKNGASLSEIFCSKDPISSFISISDELDSLRELTYSGLPVDGKVCRREYLARVCSCVKDGESILEALPRNAPQRRNVEFSLKKIRLIKSQFLNMMHAESRPVPFCVCLEGMPGIGKGLLVDYVSMIWSHVKGREFDQSHVYHRQATEKYWSGYEPASKPIIHYSEPGSLNRNIAKSQGDPVMNEFLSVADNQPYMCDMADVESKGKVFALPEFLVMDCNDPTMNLDVLVNNPAAVRRRILYITPTVKKEFVQEGTCRMDQAKSLASETPKLDRWNFSVYKMEPKDCKTSLTVRLLDGASIYELSDFLRDAFQSHIEQQDARCNILKGEKIESYLSTQIVTESFEIPDYQEKIKRFFYEQCYPRIIMYREILYEIFYSGSLAFFWFFALIFLGLLSFILWLWPQNFLQKCISMAACKNRLSYAQDKYLYWWNIHKASLGLSNDYKAKPMPTYNVGKYLMVLGGLLLLVKGYKACSIFTEGSVLSTQKDWSSNEVEDHLERIHHQSECKLPEPRSKRGNGIDWDNFKRPIPVPIDAQEQKNEASKIISSVNRNVRVMHITGIKTIETRILGVCEDLALVNRHSICHDKHGYWDAIIKINTEHSVGVIKCKLDKSEIIEVDGDIWLMRIRGAKFKDIRSYFATKHVDPAIYGNVGYIGNSTVLVKSSFPITAKDKNWGPVYVEKPLSYEWNQHSVGLCGTPLIMEYSGGRGIVGIHIAGSNGIHAFSQSIQYSDISRAITELSQNTCTIGVNSEGKIRLPKKISGLGPVNLRSPLRWEEVGGLAVYGGLMGYKPLKPGKSKLRSSEFIRYAEELTGVSPFKDGKPLFGAPPFTSGMNPETGEYQAPYNHFVKKCGVIKESLNPNILRETIDVVTKHILKGLKEKGVTSISPVTIEVAQNGFPEDFYMRAMKPSTSGGWAWPGSKKKYSRECCLPFKKDSYMPLFDVKEQVVEQLLAYEDGLDAYPLLGAQLKDEPRSYKKILDRKTRVFCMSPYESTLVNRMYLMPFYTLMVEHGDVFCTAIGINMHSTDVDEMANRMISFSDSFMEGDYGGYDTSMPYDIGLASSTVVYNICKSLGYGDHALKIVKGILSDNLYPTVVMQGDVFAAPALQPSGKYATAEDNSLRGLILLVYAWISTCTKYGAECLNVKPKCNFASEDFFTLVLPVIYGDDMLAGVKEVAKPFFNNVVYQKFCKDTYGLDFTNAQKTLEMSEFLSWDETSFLKRSFVFRDDLGVWVAQLELSSIMKSICYYLPSKSVTVDDQLIDSCVSALRELFFHLYEEEYNERRHLFAKVCGEIFNRSPNDILRLFPSFSEIRESLYGKDLQWV